MNFCPPVKLLLEANLVLVENIELTNPEVSRLIYAQTNISWTIVKASRVRFTGSPYREIRRPLLWVRRWLTFHIYSVFCFSAWDCQQECKSVLLLVMAFDLDTCNFWLPEMDLIWTRPFSVTNVLSSLEAESGLELFSLSTVFEIWGMR